MGLMKVQGPIIIPNVITQKFLKLPDTDLSQKIPTNIQKVVRKYGLFNSALYLQQNPDVAQIQYTSA